jgi:hypothetical protein
MQSVHITTDVVNLNPDQGEVYNIEDVNECTDNLTICNTIPNSQCNNMNGSYECNCVTGYEKLMYIYRFTSNLRQVQQYGGIKPVNGIPTLPS